MLGARLLCVHGCLYREGLVIRIIGERFMVLSGHIDKLQQLDGATAACGAGAAEWLSQARSFR